jgi:hypothetical protein
LSTITLSNGSQIDTGPFEIVANLTATRNENFPALSLFILGDLVGGAVTATYSNPADSGAIQYDFWNTGSGGGHFVLNGTTLSANQDNIITAAQLSQLTYQAGFGTDTLWVRANDGTVWGAWSSSFTVIVPTPTIAVTSDPTAARDQTLALSGLVTISDPGNVGYQKLELWDSDGTVGSGQFVVNGVAQTGGHEIDVAPADVVNSVFDVGTLGGTDTLWAQLLENNGQATGWQQFTVTAPAARLPTLAVTSDGSAARGQSIALSTLVTISDLDSVGYQKLELWDSAGTLGGGQFVVNGTPQTGGHEIDVTPGSVAGTVFDVGTLGGTDTLWAQLLETNGQATGWQQFTVTAPAARLPTLTVNNFSGATASETIALSTLMTISDPDSVGYQKLELWDSSGTAQGGQFVVNGTPQPGGHEIDVNPADIANSKFDVGSTGATDTLWARVLQGNGTLTPWQQFTVKDPITVAPDATVEISSTYAGAVSFAADTGTLQLDNSASFSGTVAGMSGNDTIDFTDIDPTKVQQASYAGDTSGGTLGVTDGSHSANIALLGSYLASSFVASSDGHGGTNVGQHAPTDQTSLLAQPHH